MLLCCLLFVAYNIWASRELLIKGRFRTSWTFICSAGSYLAVKHPLTGWQMRFHSEQTMLSMNLDLEGRLGVGVTRSAAPHILPRAVDYLTARIKT